VNASHCILLPVDTPLFIHVKRAVECFLPRRLAGRISTEIFNPGENSASPNDRALAQHLHSHSSKLFNDKHVIGGICDAAIAGENELEIYGGIVKRLAFAVLSPKNLNSGQLQDISVIYAHGEGSPKVCNEFLSSNSAQSFARCVACHLGRGDSIVIHPFPYGSTPDLTKSNWLLITADIGWACDLTKSADSPYRCRDAATLFPEWSRLLLSALALPKNANADTVELLGGVIQAIHHACLDIRFSRDRMHLPNLLRKYYVNISNDALATEVAFFLKERRFIPTDIEPSKYGAALATRLWNPHKMAAYTLMSPQQRFLYPESASRPKSMTNEIEWLDIPPIRGQQAQSTRREALVEAFESHAYARQTAGLKTDSVDVLILTPTEGEYFAVKKQFGERAVDLSITPEHPFRECLVRLGTPSAPFLLVIACMEKMGRVNGALTAYQEIRRWRPESVILAGIAGGISQNKDIRGDIIIVGKVIDYELQKVSEQKQKPVTQQPSAEKRPTQNQGKRSLYYDHYPFDDFLVRKAITTAHNTNWISFLPPEATRPTNASKTVSECHTEADKSVVLSGDKVIANRKVLKEPLAAYPKTIGVEMEAAGVGAAIEMLQHLNIRYVMIRAISDMANQDNSIDLTEHEEVVKNTWRVYACDVAAAFTHAFINDLIEGQNGR